jgi:hypothetical protein
MIALEPDRKRRRGDRRDAQHGSEYARRPSHRPGTDYGALVHRTRRSLRGRFAQPATTERARNTARRVPILTARGQWRTTGRRSAGRRGAGARNDFGGVSFPVVGHTPGRRPTAAFWPCMPGPVHHRPVARRAHGCQTSTPRSLSRPGRALRRGPRFGRSRRERRSFSLPASRRRTRQRSKGSTRTRAQQGRTALIHFGAGVCPGTSARAESGLTPSFAHGFTMSGAAGTEAQRRHAVAEGRALCRVAHAKTHSRRWHRAVFALPDLSSFVTGQWLRVNGGRVSPPVCAAPKHPRQVPGGRRQQFSVGFAET